MPEEWQDEFGPYLEAELRDPVFRAAYEDVSSRNAALDALVQFRRERGMSQADVAKALGVRQPTISGLEAEGSDPKLSTLQRYARALGVKVEFRVIPT